MQFNVAQLLRQATGATRHYDIDEPSEINDPDLDLVGPMRGKVALLRTQRGILVTATLSQTARVQCARCLAALEVPLELHIEQEFFPSIDLKTGAPMAWSDEDDVETETLIDEKHILDLREVARQELIVNLPAHPLCRADCAGLCPICGADRNVAPCDCQEQTVDSRWATLADFARQQ